MERFLFAKGTTPRSPPHREAFRRLRTGCTMFRHGTKNQGLKRRSLDIGNQMKAGVNFQRDAGPIVESGTRMRRREKLHGNNNGVMIAVEEIFLDADRRAS